MNTISKSDALVEMVVSIAENNDLQPRFGYSGRNMYGKNCFGLVGNIANINGFIIELVTEILIYDDNRVNSDFIDVFREMAVDSMGRDSIMYFPGLNIVDDTDSEENDE